MKHVCFHVALIIWSLSACLVAASVAPQPFKSTPDAAGQTRNRNEKRGRSTLGYAGYQADEYTDEGPLLFDEVPDWSKPEQRSALQLGTEPATLLGEVVDAAVVLVDAATFQPVPAPLDASQDGVTLASSNNTDSQAQAGAADPMAHSSKLAEMDLPRSSMDPYKFMMIMLMMITATAATISLMWFCARVFVMLRHQEPESPWDRLRKVQADLEDLYAMPYAQHQPLAGSDPDSIKAATASSYIVPPGYGVPVGRANPLHGATRKPLPV